MAMTDERLDEIRAMWKATTAGEWVAAWGSVAPFPVAGLRGVYLQIKGHGGQHVATVWENDPRSERTSDLRDGDFIADAHQAVPELLTEVARLREVEALMCRDAGWVNDGGVVVAGERVLADLEELRAENRRLRQDLGNAVFARDVMENVMKEFGTQNEHLRSALGYEYAPDFSIPVHANNVRVFAPQRAAVIDDNEADLYDPADPMFPRW
jgi:hypothetical protein